MDRKDILEIFNITNKYEEDCSQKSKLINLRIANLNDTKIIKNAFDSRRVSPTEINPRRNLQNYQRSDEFIDTEVENNLKNFFKVKAAIETIKDDFQLDPEWNDSYARILLSSIDNTLRIDQKDFDFSKKQMNYINELLFLRYRITPENIQKFNEQEIRSIILNKDEKLKHRQIFSNYKTTEKPIVKQNDNLLDQLFGNVKASKDNKEVERSVTITIKDKILEDISKQG